MPSRAPIPTDLIQSMQQTGSRVIRVGLVGLGRHGTHHAERLNVRGDFEVTCTWDRHGRTFQHARGTGGTAANWSDLVQSPDVDLVLVADFSSERSRIAGAALSAGKPVALADFLADEEEAARRLIALSGETGSPLFVLQPGRWDPAFLTARAALDSGEIGAVDAVRFINWSPPLGASGTRGRPAYPSHDEPPAAARLIDQALQLIPGRPVSVCCRWLTGRPSGSAVEASDRLQDFSILVEFEGGATACVEQFRSSSVPYQTGWLISGSTGGYRDGRLYRRVADGEVYDVPWPEVRAAESALYDELASLVNRHSAERTLAEHEVHLAMLLDAIRRVGESGEPCRLSD